MKYDAQSLAVADFGFHTASLGFVEVEDLGTNLDAEEEEDDDDDVGVVIGLLAISLSLSSSLSSVSTITISSSPTLLSLNPVVLSPACPPTRRRRWILSMKLLSSKLSSLSEDSKMASLRFDPLALALAGAGRLRVLLTAGDGTGESDPSEISLKSESLSDIGKSTVFNLSATIPQGQQTMRGSVMNEK